MDIRMEDAPAASKGEEHSQFLPQTDGEQSEHTATVEETPPIAHIESQDKDPLKNAMENPRIVQDRMKRELDLTRASLGRAKNFNCNLRNQLAASQRQVGQLEAQRNASAQDANKNRKEVDKLTAVYDNITDQLQTMQRENSNAIKERDNWRKAAEEFQEEMSRCKDALFRWQPQEQIPDFQINQEWEALCQQIARWVDDEICTNATLNTMMLKAEEAKELAELVFRFWNADVQRLAIRYPGSFDDLFRLNIHCLVEERLLRDDIYLVALPSDQAKFLCSLEMSLRKLKPARDPESKHVHQVSQVHGVAMWRSEMLNAAASLPDMEKVRSSIASDLTEDAKAFIKPLSPKLEENAMKRFHRQISVPAVSFASSLQRSTSRYHLAFGPDGQKAPRPSLLSAENKTRTVYASDIRRYQLEDMDTRKTLRGDHQILANKSGVIGEQVLPMHPAICRGVGEGRYLALGKPRVLVKLHHPMPRRGQSRHDGPMGLLASATGNFRNT